MYQATVQRKTISAPNPDPKFNATGFGVHNGHRGDNRKWHAYLFPTYEKALNFADAVNEDYNRFGPVNLGYPEPFAMSAD